MVDALREAGRVLVPGGMVLDLRPSSAKNPIEVVTARGATPVGEIDAYGAADEDSAADAAVAHAVRSGWFRPASSAQFDFEFYWDTVDDMQAFVETSRRMQRACLPFQEIEKRRRELSGEAGAARLRCHRAMMLHAYRKAGKAGS